MTLKVTIKKNAVVVCGAGGFIGGHLVQELLRRGITDLRAVDIKPLDQWFQVAEQADNQTLDLRDKAACKQAVKERDHVYNLACDMGGMGFIENHKAQCMISVLINTHLLLASRDANIERYFYSSSACVYAAEKQTNPNLTALKESDAYPAMPEDGYGWEKLFSERMCKHFKKDFGLESRIARFHNVYGSHGSWNGGREKAPAAISRKVLEAEASGKHHINIWGDGKQTRSFMYIDDCLLGILAIMHSDIQEPINLGSHQMVTINELVDLVENIIGITLERSYNLDAPKGVNGRNSDNTLIKQHLNWEPPTSLADGMKKTTEWIKGEMGKT